MPNSQADLRSERRKELDEQLASEPRLSQPEIPPGQQPRPLDLNQLVDLRRRRASKPRAVAPSRVIRSPRGLMSYWQCVLRKGDRR